MRTLRTMVPLLILPAVLGAAAPACAQLYKWVDERGVTNYSNTPPPAAATANKLTSVENKVSVYTPDDSFIQVVKAVRERAIQALTEPEPPRSPVSRIAVTQPSGYEQCMASGRLGCDDLYRTNYFPAYLPAVSVFPSRGVRPTRFLTPPPPAYQAGGTGTVRSSPLR